MINLPARATGPRPTRTHSPGASALVPTGTRRGRGRFQHGIVLVIALVMLVVVSLLASVSMRNAASTESTSSSVRTTELATQAAEIALRHCEDSVKSVVEVMNGGLPTMTTTFTVTNILPAGSATHWESPANWDAATTATFVLPLALLNDASLRSTYQRAPECMVAPLPVILLNQAVPSNSSAFVVTARGFGPEVAAGTGRPLGTEVWLQSHLQLE
jgi:type IV pilus assembly protein PilX